MHPLDVSIIIPEVSPSLGVLGIYLLFGGIFLGVACMPLTEAFKSYKKKLAVGALGVTIIIGSTLTPWLVDAHISKTWYTETAQLLNIEEDLQALKDTQLMRLAAWNEVVTLHIATQQYGPATLHIDGRALTLTPMKERTLPHE